MNVHIAKTGGQIFRKIIAINLFRFSVQLGIALSRADNDARPRNRRSAHPPDVPHSLRQDVGLPPYLPVTQWWDYR